MRAVGFNPEAARYGGISVAKSYILAMAIAASLRAWEAHSTSSAGSSGSGQIDVQSLTLPFIGIAVALLGRNTAVGVAPPRCCSARLNGTSTRNLDPEVFQPELAGNLTLMIQALVLLFVGADLLILGLMRAPNAPGCRKPRAPAAEAPT